MVFQLRLSCLGSDSPPAFRNGLESCATQYNSTQGQLLTFSDWAYLRQIEGAYCDT